MFQSVHSTQLSHADYYRSLWRLEKARDWTRINALAEKPGPMGMAFTAIIVATCMGGIFAGPGLLGALLWEELKAKGRRGAREI